MCKVIHSKLLGLQVKGETGVGHLTTRFRLKAYVVKFIPMHYYSDFAPHANILPVNLLSYH